MFLVPYKLWSEPRVNWPEFLHLLEMQLNRLLLLVAASAYVRSEALPIIHLQDS